MSAKPKYWDSWRGQILKAIALHDARTWAEIKEKSGLPQNKLFKVMGELLGSGLIKIEDKTGEKTYWITNAALVEDYKRAGEKMESTIEKPAGDSSESSATHIEWLKNWIEQDKVSASLDHLHFFVEGRNLSHLANMLMQNARHSIMVVTPFVDRAGLGTAFRDAAKRGVGTLLITRSPEGNPSRREFHDTLKAAQVEIYYSGTEGGVHSKLIVVDEEVAIVSSMNFTKEAEAAVSWETGIVTTDKEVIENIVESVKGLRDQDETTLA